MSVVSTRHAPERVEEKEGLRHEWPLTWSDAGLFVLAFVFISAAWVGLGKLIIGPLDGSVGAVDRHVAELLADNRTPALNHVSYWGSMLSETTVKIGLTAVAVVVMLIVWRSWREPLFVALSLILEASCFLAITLVVSRPRPDVPRLDGSPVDSSFPSGHVAAAVCYGAFAVVVFLRTRRMWIRALVVALVVAVPIAVGWARMYRGMHFFSDVIAGALLGALSLIVSWLILERERA